MSKGHLVDKGHSVGKGHLVGKGHGVQLYVRSTFVRSMYVLRNTYVHCSV